VAELRVIVSPFDSGLPDVGMGAGSTALAGEDALRFAPVETVPAVEERIPEIARVIELDRRLAGRVRSAVRSGAFPLVLAGNCNSSLGTVSGLRPGPLGVVWFDAHADFDTPDENISGFFDVMGLSILTGGGWQALAATIPGFVPVEERHVVLAGVRDLEPYQRSALERSSLRTVPGAFAPPDLEQALDELRREVQGIYLHVDLDALDAGEGRANRYAAPGGPSVATLLEAVDLVFDRFDVRAAALTAYDPAADADGRAGAVAAELLARIVRRAGSPQSANP
jgi:arginase